MKSMLYDIYRYICTDVRQISITLPSTIKIGAEIISNEETFLGHSILIHTRIEDSWTFNNKPVSKELVYQCELINNDDWRKYKIVGFSSPFVSEIIAPKQVASYLAKPITTSSNDAIPSIGEIKSILESNNESVSVQVINDKLSITIGSDTVKITDPNVEFAVGSKGLLDEQTLNDN